MTPPARQQPCSAADARTRLAHARKFLEVAELGTYDNVRRASLLAIECQPTQASVISS